MGYRWPLVPSAENVRADKPPVTPDCQRIEAFGPPAKALDARFAAAIWSISSP